MSKKLSILVVDDEPDIISIVIDLLNDAVTNTEITSATDGSTAHYKMQTQHFDLVVCDVNLGKTNGTSLVQFAANLPLELRPSHFFLISGGSDPHTPPSKLGKIHFLPKPLKADGFITLVQSLLAPETRITLPPQVPSEKELAFIEPFIAAATMVLEVTSGITAKQESIFIRNNDQPTLGDISAVLAMNSETYLGSMAITFDESCFINIVNGMLGEQYTSITIDNQDAATELCNQIFGHAKKILNQRGHTLRPAIPTLVIGSHHRIRHSAQGTCIAVKFSTPTGAFVIEAVTQS